MQHLPRTLFRWLASLGLMVALVSLAPLPAAAQTVPLRVSAAASLSDVLKEINAGFEKQSGARVVLNLGASSLLVRQIEAGAPADIFFSADGTTMDQLRKAGLIDVSTREDQLSNALVVIVPAGESVPISSGSDLLKPDIRRIALGNPKAVPAGVYAKAWLTRLGLWQQVESKVLATDNVRSALAAVESGNVEAGVVYKTDAAISPKVRVAYEIPAAESPGITYPMAVLKDARNQALAKQYLDYLDAPESHALFVKHGFIVLPEKDS
jgi:molybdate transport system substrate-binding protein